MNKQTKLWVGIGLVAVAGFLYWKQSQKKKSFANYVNVKDNGFFTAKDGGFYK